MRLTVQMQQPYTIEIGDGLLAQSGRLIRGARPNATRVLVVSDSNVAPLYGGQVCSALKAAGFAAESFTFPAGEENKQLQTVQAMLEAMARMSLTRGDLAVALGGGVTGDLTGFAAAVYMRGIDFVQIPTTLLAQIDSSVGGKTGCDLPAGKNLVGAFHNPCLVLIDPATLRTLPSLYWKDGLAEAVKYGCIADVRLFERLETEDPRVFLPELIGQCVRIKQDIVQRDFRESGERMLLNFGHTVGHALEAQAGFRGISHGFAVGIGMAVITEAAERAGMCKAGAAARIRACLERFGLPSHSCVSNGEIARFAAADKKRRADTLQLVLLREVGSAFIHNLPLSEFEAFLENKRCVQ